MEGRGRGGRDGGGGVEWSDGGRGREGGGCGVKGEWYSHIIPSLLLVGGRFRMRSDCFCTWAIGFMHGWLFSYQAVVFLCGWLVVVLMVVGLVVLVVVIGRVLVVLLPRRRGRRGPCIWCEREKGSGM